MKFSAVLVLLSLTHVTAFKFLSNWKGIPRPSDVIKKRQAKNRFGGKKIVVITGTSSGLGRKTARELLRTGDYHVVGAVRDLDKMATVALDDDFPKEDFTPMHVDLNSFDSVRQFCDDLKKFKCNKPVDRLICNAGVYQPSLPHAQWSEDGHEQQMQVNYLSHFLIVSLLLPDLQRAQDPRVVLVGAGASDSDAAVYPIADLKQLEGLKAGAKNPISMFDGYNFIGTKAYKDSKLCLMMFSNMLHDRYNRQTGIAFSSVYPGCVADSPLYRERKPPLLESLFTKYFTGGFVGEEAAGMRLFQVAHDPRCSKSGVFWSWNSGAQSEVQADEAAKADGGADGGWDSIYENDQSDKVLDKAVSADLWSYSSELTGAAWPMANQPKSPCPTLKVIGSITNYMNAKEEAKRMIPVTGGVKGGAAKVLGSTGLVADVLVGNTVGLVAKKAQDALLGSMPEEAVQGSFQETRRETKGRKRGLRRVLFWRKAEAEPRAVVAPAAAAAVASERSEEEEAAIAMKLDAVLDGGMQVPAARAALQDCVDDEGCEAEKEAQLSLK